MPSVPKHVVVKLLGFTGAMASLPLTVYYASVDRFFAGNTTYAAVAAAATANLIAILYVVAAVLEDRAEQPDKQKKQE